MAGGTEASAIGAVAIHGDVNNSIISTISSNHSASTFKPRHQLPSDLPDFTGRSKEVDELVAALDRDCGGAAAVSAIRGMGGIGKTTLAVHATRRLLHRYPDAQIMVNLQGHSDASPLTAQDAMAQVVRAFHPDMNPVDDPDQMAAIYRSVLEGKRALILLDNAADTAQVERLVPPPPCGLIVTAREPIHLDGATRLNLGLLPRAESVELLRAAASPKQASDEEWNRIAELCGDLPLALRVAASYLAHAEDCTAAEYIADLTDERTRLDHLKLERKERGDVGAVLAYSARRFAETDPDLAALWQMLTVFPADFDRVAAAAVWNLETEKNAVGPLRKLLDRALVIFEDGAKRYRLHDLMRPLAHAVFTKAPAGDPSPGSNQRLDKAIERFSGHYMSILEQADRLFSKGHDNVLAGLALYDQEARNIAAAAEWAWARRTDNRVALDISAWLPDRGPHVLHLRLTPRQRLKWLAVARDAAKSIGDKKLEGMHLGNLGLAYADLGETRRAIEHYEQALAISREIGDRRGEGSSFGNLGNAYADLGETPRAIEHHEQALAISREIGDRRGEGSSFGNLGNAYADLGETPRAIEHHEQALAISREIGDRYGEGSDLSNLGNAYADLGETERAIQCVEQALAIFEDIESPYAEQARWQLAELRGETEAG